MTKAEFPWQHPALIQHSQWLCQSFQHWLGYPLVEPPSPQTLAQTLYETPFVVLSHGMEADPILNYGNRAALELWQIDWSTFTQMPSRLTAELPQREERERLLRQAAHQGFISNYRGVRIAGSGQRFLIEDAIIWNVLNAEGQKWGQAAMFKTWQWLTQ